MPFAMPDAAGRGAEVMGDRVAAGSSSREQETDTTSNAERWTIRMRREVSGAGGFTPHRRGHRRLLAGLLFMTTFAPIAKAEDDARFRELVPADSKVEKLGTGMKFIEGPVWTDIDGGKLLFSDIPASELKAWTAAK